MDIVSNVGRLHERPTPNIQMRSGPATRTALFWRKSCFPFSTHEAWAKSDRFTCTPKSPGTSPTRKLSLAKRTSRSNLQHYGGQRPVLPCVEDS
jgi:hypothetical protein